MMIRRTALAVLALSTAAFGLTAQAATVGQAAPDFTLTDVNGKAVKLSDFKGKTVVLEWTNPGCPFVRKHYQQSGNMPKLQKEKADAGVVWLAINSTEAGHGDYLAPAKMGAWMTEQKAAATATLMDTDGKVGQAYAAKTTPHMYVIDAKGMLAYAGAIDSISSAKADDISKATNFVRAAVADLKAGKAVATPSTRPYGCSVKYKS
jgi:alkyl hydroperoxide reductase subunit AhpC